MLFTLNLKRYSPPFLAEPRENPECTYAYRPSKLKHSESLKMRAQKSRRAGGRDDRRFVDLALVFSNFLTKIETPPMTGFLRSLAAICKRIVSPALTRASPDGPVLRF